MGGATPDVARWRWATTAAAAAVVTVATLAAWALAQPQNSLGGSAVRAASDIAAVLVLGLAVVPRLDGPRYRDELASRATVPLITASAAWTITEAVRLVVTAAQSAGTTVARIDVSTAVGFALDSAGGRSGLLCLGAATAVCLATVFLPRTDGVAVATAGVAALGLTARSLVGHLSESAVGGAAVAVHALAAGLWCGVLAALVLTVRHRGQWARVLPRFSRMSLVCVGVLLAAGIAGAVAVLPSPAALYDTPYGRVLLAKVALTVALTVLAWRNRTIWLPAARGHRASADTSRLRSRIELAVMGVAVVMAAALAVTG